MSDQSFCFPEAYEPISNIRSTFFGYRTILHTSRTSPAFSRICVFVNIILRPDSVLRVFVWLSAVPRECWLDLDMILHVNKGGLVMLFPLHWVYRTLQ